MGTSALPYKLGLPFACQAKVALDNEGEGRIFLIVKIFSNSLYKLKKKLYTYHKIIKGDSPKKRLL